MLPGYDILATVQAKVVAISKKIEQIEAGEVFGCRISQGFDKRKQMAVAAQAGDVQMLGRLIDELDSPEEKDRIWFYSTNRYDTWRHYVTPLISFKGTNAEIAQWYEANRDELAFDNFTKRYVILEDF